MDLNTSSGRYEESLRDTASDVRPAPAPRTDPPEASPPTRGLETDAPSVDLAEVRHSSRFDFDRVICVANATFFEKTVEGAYQNTVGGLVSGVSPVLAAMPGSMVISSDVQGKLDDFQQWAERPFDAAGVRLMQQEYDRYYLEVSNGLFWPAFHGLRDQVSAVDEVAWMDYRNVNAAFANTILNNVQPNDLVWIHDYHLTLAPGMLRALEPGVQVAYFHHIPFPSPQEFRELVPTNIRKAVLSGLLGSDLVGFHTMGFARNFLSAVHDAAIGAQVDFKNYTVKFGGRTISVGAFPISVDVKSIEAKLRDPEVLSHAEELRAAYPDRTILFGVERLDYTKGIEERILAVGELLEAHPELAGTFTLVQYVAPSRSELDAYKELRSRVEAAAESVNAQYGRPDWKPVDLHIKKLEFDKVLGYSRGADVVVVTPRVDGMNLVIKEAIIAARPDCAFILGRGAGAAEGLPDALLVDGGNPSSIAEGMWQALDGRANRPEDIERRNEALKDAVHSYPVALWGMRLVEAAREAVDRRYGTAAIESANRQGVLAQQAADFNRSQSPHVSRALAGEYSSAHDVASLLLDSNRVLFALDYDGTLTSIVARPEWARPDRVVLSTLEELSSARGTDVAIVSGRSVEQLKDFLAPLEGCPILLCGLHGGEIYDFGNGEYLRRLDPELRVLVAAFQTDLARELYARSINDEGIRFENKGYSLALHYRNAPELADRAIRAMRDVFEVGGYDEHFRLIEGKMVVEMVPKSCSKGAALEYLYRRSVSAGESPTICMVGDDLTDESAFRTAPVLDPNAVTVRVGDLGSDSAAKLRLPSPDAVHELITAYIGQRLVD